MVTLFNNLSIRIRLVILIAVILVGMATFLMVFFPRTLGNMAETWLERRAEVIAHVLSDALSGYVEWEDEDGAKRLLERLGPATEIEYAVVRELSGDANNETVASENFAGWMPDLLPADLDLPGETPTVRRAGGRLLVSMRINSTTATADQPGRHLGVLYVGISLADLDAQRQEILRIVALVSLGLALVGVLFALAIGTIIVRPIRALTEVTANIVSEGDLTQTIDVTSRDEVGQLAASFRAMVEKLQAIPRSLAELVDSVTTVTDTASQTTSTVSDGASTVHARVAEAASAMHQMTATLASIATNVDELHQSAEHSTRSNEEMVQATKQITGRVVAMASSADGANHAVEKMTAAIKEIARRINELDSSVETTASAMTEMHSSIQSVERTAVETNKLSQRVAEDAVIGVATLERTLAGIDRITQSSAAVSAAIESLGARIGSIGSILEVILEVATQTKLLALNAAILAAQAGEHGRGFGILADQIKGLAARTNASATEIGDLITNIQSESNTALATMREGSTFVEEGVRLANETAEVLRTIEQSANSASTMVQRITDATVEQSRSTKRVLASVDTIAATFQEVSRAAGEQAEGSEQIVAATGQMKAATDSVRRSSSEQADATQGIAMSVANIHDMAAQLARAQSEQASTANNTLATVEAIKTVADEQLHAVGALETAIRRLSEHSDQLRAAISQFRV